MTDPEYSSRIMKVEVEEKESADGLSNCSMKEIKADQNMEGLGENSQLTSSFITTVSQKLELPSKAPDIQNIKGKLLKLNSLKACPHCKKTFYHLCALSSHVRHCSFGKSSRLSSGNINIKSEPVMEIENKNEDGSSLPELQFNNVESSSDKSKNVSYTNIDKAREKHFKGTKFKRACEDCGLTFKSISHARSHAQRKKLYCRKPPFKCNRCGKVCKNIHYLVDHERSKVSCRKWLMLNQGDGFSDTMYSADESFERGSNLINQVPDSYVSSSSKKMPVNGLDDAHILEYAETDYSNKNKHSSEDISVKEESLVSSESITESIIVADHKNHDLLQEHCFSCQKCDLKFLNSYRLRKHVLSMHRNINSQSTRCNPSRISTSVKKDSNSMSLFKCEGGYRCPTCETVFTYPSKLSAHLFRKGPCYPPNAVKKDTGFTRFSGKSEHFQPDHESSSFPVIINEEIYEENPELTTGFDRMAQQTCSDLGSAPENNQAVAHKILNTGAPKHKIMKKVINKYRKIAHQVGGTVPYCEFCQLSFCNKASLSKHYQKYHDDSALPPGDISPISQSLGCPFCDRLFHTIKARNAHVRYGHKEIAAEAELFLRETQCEICARAFETVSEKTDHCSTLHGNRSEVQLPSGIDPNFVLKCVHCGAQFTTKHHYSAHVNRYCPAKREQITQEEPSELVTTAEQAKEIKNPVKRAKEEFVCAHCQTKFSYRTLYKAHVTRYCPMKQASSRPNDQLVSRKSIYSCPYCQMKFAKKHAYETHTQSLCSMRPSTSESNIRGPWFGKQYSCWGCRNVFESRKTLYNHQKMGCTGITFGPDEEKAKTVTNLRTIPNSSGKAWPGVGFSYVCRGCQKRFNSRQILHYHQKTVCKNLLNHLNVSSKASVLSKDVNVDGSNENASFVCRGCNHVFSSKKTLYNHQKLVCKKFSIVSKAQNPDKPHKETVERQVMKNYKSKSNELSSSNAMLYTCHGCQERFQTRKDLYVHKVTQCFPHDRDSPGEDEHIRKPKTGFSCKRCNKRCFSRKVLYVHQKFQCKYSKFKSSTLVPIPNPKMLSSEPSLVSPDVDQRYYNCRGCPEKFKSRKDLFIHHKFYCIGRKHLFETQNNIEETNFVHTENNSNETQASGIKYSCTTCKKGFCNRRDLHVHKKFNCHRSGDIKSTASTEDAISVIVTSPIKRYACKMCSNTFADRKVLYIHHKFDCPGRQTASESKDIIPSTSSVHTSKPINEVMTPEISEKLQKFPNQCPFCNRQYCNPFVRDRHIRLHTMVKSFRCSFCPQTFSRSEYLTRHLQNEHSDSLRYQCGQCGLKYAHRVNCIQHINKLHKVADKSANVIDLDPFGDDSTDLAKQIPGDISSCPPLSVPKLTLKRTSLITRFKKRKAVWRPAVTTNMFRVVDDTPGRGIYSCDLCQIAKFTKMSALHRHWRSKLHRENVSRQRVGLDPLPQIFEDTGPLMCSVCHCSFPNVHAFVPHRLSHLNDPLDISDINPYSCEICSSVFTHHQRVQGHLMWHLRVSKSKVVGHDDNQQPQFLVPAEALKPIAKKSISPVKLSETAFPVKEKSALSQLSMGPFSCELCSAQYSTKAGVITHMRRFCPKRFMCNKCGQCFSNSRVLAYHTGRKDCSATPAEDRFRCRHCSLDLDTVEDLGWHEKSCQKVHESEKSAFQSCELEPLDPENLSCNSCKEMFSSLSAVAKHKETCQAACSVVPSLSYHCLQCMICIENFYSIRIMEKHTLLHHRDRFFVRCLPCQKLYYNLQDLSEHISQLSVKISPTEDDRTSEVASIDCINSSQSDSSVLPPRSPPRSSQTQKRKVHKCQYCSRVFRDTHNLKLHTVVHNPFTCPVCKKVEKSKEGFRIHPCRLPDGSYATGLKHHFPLRNKCQSSVVSTPSSDHVSFPVSESDLDSQEPVTKVSEISLPPTPSTDTSVKTLESPLSELSKLRGDFSQLMFFLVADPELMTQLGWGQKPIDTVLEDVLEHLGEKPANRSELTYVKATDLDLLRNNVRRFLSISIKDDVLSTVEELSHSSVDKVVSKMLVMCTENGDALEGDAAN